MTNTFAVTLASVRALFFPLWLPLTCFQKRQVSALPAQLYMHNKSPTAMVLAGLLVASRRPNSRPGQILHSCIIDGNGRFNFQTAANAGPPQKPVELFRLGAEARLVFDLKRRNAGRERVRPGRQLDLELRR